VDNLFDPYCQYGVSEETFEKLEKYQKKNRRKNLQKINIKKIKNYKVSRKFL
jgi:hypothetical protein